MSNHPELPQPIRILMLEDNPIDAELLQRHLRRDRLDFALTVVDDEPRFRELLESTAPDIILSDYSMPKFDGLSALRIARALAPETPFIFVSGSIGEERAVEALREGATDYVVKDRPSRLPSAIVRALTERRERSLRQSVEQALRASEQRFQYAAAATQEIIWDWNLVTSRIWFNDALRDHWGYEIGDCEVPAEWFRERIHPDDRDAVFGSLMEAIRQPERWRIEFRLARADKSYRNVVSRGVIVRDGEDIPVRVIGAILDITERLRLQEQLEQTKRVESLGRVVATVTHEFNNVLMGMAPIAEILRRKPTPQNVDQSATRISDVVARGRRFTEQILRFGKPAQPMLARADFARWLERLATELQSLAGTAIAVATTIRDAPLPVLFDAHQLNQVVSNLVLNARDAMTTGGLIRLTAEAAGEFACLTIEDDGAGIPEDVLQRIFEPLFTTKRCGTGLGLAVAQQIILRHGGTIEVTSTVGQGTTFQILLPLAPAAEEAHTGVT